MVRFFIGVVMTAFLAPVALAEDDDDKRQIEEVIVTAERVESTVSDTSISNVMAIRAEVIARSRALREAQPTAPPGVTPTAPVSNFADTLNAVVAKVNETQEQEDVVTEAYERGETTDIATVALIQSRASITFEATLQVRNKLLSAYRDIMNMPIG